MIQKLLVQKPIIIADYREKEIIEILKNEKEINVIEENLNVDFIIGDIAIERKTYKDFLNSTFDKRIFEQIENKNEFKKYILILEGSYIEEDKKEIFYGILSKILASTNISVIFTENIYETAKLLIKICKKYSSDFIVLPKAKRKIKKNQEEMKKLIISILINFPGVSYKTAEKILKKFKSIKNFINAEKHKLVDILGEKRAKKFLKIINYEYSE
ncbi:MAG: ERCC4 domain-containing protein [Candidatus Aenigmatarchaeota archaeon]|nr:hypothetical protein [Candidatus Aenigmarchaeota archaeon]